MSGPQDQPQTLPFTDPPPGPGRPPASEVGSSVASTRLPEEGAAAAGVASEATLNAPGLQAEATPALSVPMSSGVLVTISPSEDISGAAAESGPCRLPFGPNLPGYEILGELGRGGMGVVYKARQLRPRRLVALKVIKAAECASDKELARFRAEAEAVAQLNHPNIVALYEVGDYAGQPYFSLEFVEGGSLDRYLQGIPQPPRDSAALVRTLALAMQSAHQASPPIVHRDLKPANILLAAPARSRHDSGPAEEGKDALRHRSESGASSLPSAGLAGHTPKVADFGLAKQLDGSGATVSGTIVGTPSYMAPEQAEGRTRDIDARTDVYALGALLYECLTGRAPFKGATALDTLAQVIDDEPVPPRQLQPKVPRDLETVCLKCLQKTQGRRYASALALADDLQRFLEDQPVLARPLSLRERGLRWARRHPVAALLAGLSCLAASVLVAAVFWYNSHLRDTVARARAEEQQARAAERQARADEHRAREGQRLAQLLLESEASLRAGRAALDAKDWHNADVALSRALAGSQGEEKLAGLRTEARTLLDRARQEIARQQDARRAEERRRQFAEQRDEALFHATAFTGLDPAAGLRATRQAARQGLALYALDRPARLEAEVRAGCYELLLVLAEALAQPLSGEDAAAQARKALAELDRAAALGRDATHAYHRRRARYLRGAGRVRDAAAAEAAATRTPPVTALDFFLVGDEHARRDQLDDAIRSFERVLRVRPDHAWAQYFLALCQLRQHRPAEARAHLTACMGRLGKRGFLWVHLLRGFASSELKDVAAAEEDYRAALKQHPSGPVLYGLHVNRGTMFLQQKKFAAAADDFRRAITLRPDFFQAHVNLAELCRQQGQPEEALVHLGRAIVRKPDLPALYRERARLLRTLGRRTEALRELDRSLQCAKNSPADRARAYAQRGWLLLIEKRYTEAVAACDEALAARRDRADPHHCRAEALLGLRRYADAAESYGHYLRFQNGQPRPEVHRKRGLALAKTGDYPSALDDLTQALAGKPDDAELYAGRGWVYLVCQSPRLALHDFEQALALTRTADALNGRGFARAQLGQAREALADAEAALRHEPPTSRTLYNAARIFARAPEADEGKATRPGAFRNHCHERALDLLGQSLARQSAGAGRAFWKSYVETDRALDSLRHRPAFARLRREYSAAGREDHSLRTKGSG